MSEKCETCRFWRMPDGLSLVVAGTLEPTQSESRACVRYAPVPRGGGDDLSTWPATRPGYWCGDYEALL